MKRGYKETEIGEIPEEWEVKSLESISDDLINGGTPTTDNPNYWVGDIPWISGADIVNQEVGVVRRFITHEAVRNSSTNIVKKGNLLVVSRTGVGKLAIAPYDIAISQDFTGVFPKKSEVRTDFLFHFLNRKKNVLIAQNQGTSIQGIKREVLASFPIPLPPLPEQKKIAEVLSSVDESIRATQAVIEQAKVLKQGMLNQLLTKGIGHKKFKETDIGKIPVEWEVKTLEDIACEKGLVRGPFGGAIKKECFVESGYKIYEQQNAIYADAKTGRYFIDESKFEELRRFEVKAGDFIISCSGTIGRIYQIPRDFEKGIINQALLKVTINNSICSNDFFLQYFRWDEFQKTIIDSTQGGAMKNLVGMDKFRKTLIPLPSIQEQKAITNILLSFDAIENINNDYLKKLQISKSGLMQDLLSGKKRVKV